MSDDAIRFVRKSMTPGKPVEQPKPREDLIILHAIAGKLDRLIEKPDPLPPHIAPPVVTVHVPPVEKRVRKWKFTVHRINEANTEITAEAVEGNE